MGWVQRLFGRARLEIDLEKELRYHIERRVSELLADGVIRRKRAEGADRIRRSGGN